MTICDRVHILRLVPRNIMFIFNGLGKEFSRMRSNPALEEVLVLYEYFGTDNCTGMCCEYAHVFRNFDTVMRMCCPQPYAGVWTRD